MASTSRERYVKVQDLNEGLTGKVILATDTVTNEPVAVKLIPRTGVTRYTLAEIQTLRKLQHPNIVGFKRVILTSGHLGIVMEYVKDGNLYEYVRDKGRLDEEEARGLFQQMVAAIYYCHCQNISNRDVKLDNTLIVKDPTGASTHIVKLCDFGFAKDDTKSKADTKVGTLDYYPPEVIMLRRGQSYDPKKSDVWSCGVALLVMLTRSYPFRRPEDDSCHEVVRLNACVARICKADYIPPTHVTSSCLDLLSRMLCVDPKQRASMTDILQHQWFLHNLSPQLSAMIQSPDKYNALPPPSTAEEQSEEEICRLVQQALQVQPLGSFDDDPIAFDGRGTPVPHPCSTASPTGHVSTTHNTGSPATNGGGTARGAPYITLQNRGPVNVVVQGVANNHMQGPPADFQRAVYTVQSKAQDLRALVDQMQVATNTVRSHVHVAGQVRHPASNQALRECANNVKAAKEQLDQLLYVLNMLY